MRSVDKGTITELEVQYILVKNGYSVFTPVNEGCKVDLVFIDKNGAAKKVQVKKSNLRKCGFGIELRYSKGRYRNEKCWYTEEEIDYFATTFDGKLYLIPVKDVINRSNVILRFNNKYRNQNPPFFAKDYLMG